MVVGVAGEGGGGLEPVEVAAEGLDGGEFADDGEAGFVFAFGGDRDLGVGGGIGGGGGGGGGGSGGDVGVVWGGRGEFGLGVMVDRPAAVFISLE